MAETSPQSVRADTFVESLADGINLEKNSQLLAHGWTVGPLLMEFCEHMVNVLEDGPMTSEALADRINANVGPVALTLRSCAILGYVECDKKSGEYKLVEGQELSELQRFLGPQAPERSVFKTIYEDAVPPFKIDSNAFKIAVATWKDYRDTWKDCSSATLPVLLDGIILTPLLGSLTYFARWNEAGDDKGKEALKTIDFTGLDFMARLPIANILQETGCGQLKGNDNIAKMNANLEKAYAYFVPISFDSLLSRFNYILFRDASWGFVPNETEAPESDPIVNKVLNEVGHSKKVKALYKDMMKHLAAVFSGHDFEHQPNFIIDAACGTGKLLVHAYDFVRNETSRGQVLDRYPLTMIGIDSEDDHRMATSVNLSKLRVPHKVFTGSIDDTEKITKVLSKKIDMKKALHLRAFKDHTRQYIAPTKKTIAKDSACAKFVEATMGDAAYLDKDGKPISALDMFGSLLEHFERWAQVLDGSYGCCLLEAMSMDIQTTKTFFNDNPCFHADIVEQLARNYFVPPAAFSMAASMSGLIPKNVKNNTTYPEHMDYTRVLNEHLHRPKHGLKIRLAEHSDMPRLMVLEDLAWGDMAMPEETVVKRLINNPAGVFACTIDGEVIAVLYTQRIPTVDTVQSELFSKVSDWHTPGAPVVQLLAINVDPKVAQLGIAQDLRAFALQLARMDPTVTTVCAVTRCLKFPSFDGTMDEYLDKHVKGTRIDPIVDFHTGYGAKFVALVHDYRPEDTDNKGIGVCIQYHLKKVFGIAEAKPVQQLTPASNESSLDMISGIMADMGFEVDEDELDLGFFDYDMDSLELVRIRNKLASDLQMQLPSTLLLDFPNVAALAEQLDLERGRKQEMEDKRQEAKPQQELTPEQKQKKMWDELQATDVTSFMIDCKKAYLRSDIQQRFTSLARMCYPDTMQYVLAVEPVLMEVQGKIFRERNWIDDLDFQSIQTARARMTEAVARYWRQVPEVRKRSLELSAITKQDQIW